MTNEAFLLLQAKTPTFFAGAKCRGMGPEHFFPPNAHSVIAAKFCDNCPVISECRNYALVYRMDFGIWGGLTETKRRKMRRADNGR